MRRSIREIVADTDAGLRGPKLLWRAHEWDCWHATSPMKQLYVGAAGVIWGLDALRRRGHAETTLDLSELALRNLERFRERPDYIDWNIPEPRESALFLGEAGIVLVAWRLAPSRGARGPPARPRALERREPRGGGLLGRAAARSWPRGRWSNGRARSAGGRPRTRPPKRCFGDARDDGLWVQRLYGQEMTSLTPPHGVVGIVQALVPLLDRERGRSLQHETGSILERAAVLEDGARELAAETAPGAPRTRRADPPPVVRGCAGDRHRSLGVPRRGALARRSGARVARRAATGWRRARASATARPATATRS